MLLGLYRFPPGGNGPTDLNGGYPLHVTLRRHCSVLTHMVESRLNSFPINKFSNLICSSLQHLLSYYDGPYCYFSDKRSPCKTLTIISPFKPCISVLFYYILLFVGIPYKISIKWVCDCKVTKCEKVQGSWTYLATKRSWWKAVKEVECNRNLRGEMKGRWRDLRGRKVTLKMSRW